MNRVHISPNDHKEYKELLLENDLRVLLIHDVTAHKSSAALAIRVGHYDDPQHRQGLAHFLEHMLFLGTQKYPQVGEFQTFINRNGGSNNAWTGTEHTCFFFDIKAQAFEGAIDRFSQFFISPLFNPDALDKERHAVQSEFELKYKDEMRRQYQVHKEVINPKHPFAKFSVGNLETLSDQGTQSIRDEVIDFYTTNYSSDLMTLVLAGPQSLDELEHIVTQKFANITNNQRNHKSIHEPLWRDEDKQQFVHIAPEKESRKLTLAFLFPAMDAFYQTKPLSYFAHLLGDESPGSLLEYLKSKKLITSLSAGGGISGNNFREFSISCALTQDGLNQIDEIIETIFYAIELIKKDGIAKWRYDEKSAVLESAFRFQETGQLIDLTNHLAMNLQLFEFNDVIYGDYMMSHYDEDHLKSLLAYFSPHNLRVTVVAKQQTQKSSHDCFDLSQPFENTANWYDTPYRVSFFTPEQLQHWLAPKTINDIYLPKPNPYICSDFRLSPLKEKQTHPKLLQSMDGFRLWHMQDHEFNVPKGVIFIAIDSPHAVSTPRTIVKTRLCVEMFLDALSQETYQAEIAGMGYHIYAHQGGVTLMLTGFSQKQSQLLDVIIHRFTSRNFSQQRFKSIKTQLKRHWNNRQKDRPVSQLFNAMSGLLQPNNPPSAELALALETIRVGELSNFVEQMIGELHIEMFVYGDWAADDAVKLADSLKHALRVKDQKYEESLRPLVMLHQQGTLVHEIKCQQDDSAILVYYQSNQIDAKAVATYSLANHLMSAAFFHELRTKQQLGYMVGTSNLPLNRHPGLVLYVQSPNAAPVELIDAIDDFLNAFYLVLLELSEEAWQNSKQGLLHQILMPDNNLRARGQRLWTSIGNQDYQFNFRETVHQALAELSRKDMIEFVVKRLKPRTANRLVMHTKGNKHQAAASIKEKLGNNARPFTAQNLETNMG